MRNPIEPAKTREGSSERPTNCAPTAGSSKPTAALLQLLPGREGRLPDVRWTLPVGEVAHRALVAKVARGKRVDCPELTGQNTFGQPLTHGHRHAHVLPLDLDTDGAIDHLLVYVPAGMGPAACRAVQDLSLLRLSRTSFGRSLPERVRKGATIRAFPDLRLAVRHRSFLAVVDESAHPSSVAAMSARTVVLPLGNLGASADLSGVQNVLVGCHRWLSVTPLVPPRFLKKSGKNGLDGQVQSELQSRGLPPATRIEVLERFTGSSSPFHIHRHGEKTPPPQSVAFSLLLEFDRPVVGPIALGYASHFGMGLFGAADKREG